MGYIFVGKAINDLKPAVIKKIRQEVQGLTRRRLLELLISHLRHYQVSLKDNHSQRNR